MTDLLPQVDIEADLKRLMAAAEGLTHQIKDLALDAARKEHAYRDADAHAYHDAEGTVAERERAAFRACSQQYLDRKLAEATLRAAEEAGRNVRAQLEALRSLNANHRALVVGS